MNIYIVDNTSKLGRFLSILSQGNESTFRKAFPNSNMAIMRSANEFQREWITNIRKSNSKEGWKEGYVDSISMSKGESIGSVVVSASGMYADFVENGVTRFDMKNPPNGKGLLNSSSTKTAEDGSRYNVIFMRKGVPGTQHIRKMPEVIHSQISKLKYGESLKEIGKLGMTKQEKQTMESRGWKSGLYEGITKIGRGKHSQYGTFRVISSKSKGWIYPGAPASPVFKTTFNKMKPIVERMLKKGLEDDLISGLERFVGGKK